MSSLRINNDERGWVLVIAMVVMVLMLGIGLAALSISDTQNQSSRKEREREASLNLAEGALYAQSFILALPPSGTGQTEGWPGAFEKRYVTCDQATGGIQCPNDAALANVAHTTAAPASFANVDTLSGTTWHSWLQDNGGSTDAQRTDYANHTTDAYDKNGDDKIWVVAQAKVRNHTRTVVGLMQIEDIPISVPRTAITAGSFTLSQSGNNTYIDTGSTSVQLRCSPVTSLSCANWDTSKPGEITGAPASIVSNPSTPSVLSADDLARFKSKALALNAYYPASSTLPCPGVRNANGCCPTGDQMQAATVYVENCNATYGSTDVPNATQCSYSIRGYTPVSNQRCIHGPGKDPFGGTIVWERGTLGFTSGVAFFGVIYHLNLNTCGMPKTDDGNVGPGLCPYDGNNQSILVTTNGGGSIIGSVNIDGNGAVEAGNNKYNIVYDPAVFADQTGFGTTGLVQNTWRELDLQPTAP
jgi:Tfp pilus assembly protein PilX